MLCVLCWNSGSVSCSPAGALQTRITSQQEQQKPLWCWEQQQRKVRWSPLLYSCHVADLWEAGSHCLWCLNSLFPYLCFMYGRTKIWFRWESSHCVLPSLSSVPCANVTWGHCSGPRGLRLRAYYQPFWLTSWSPRFSPLILWVGYRQDCLEVRKPLWENYGDASCNRQLSATKSEKNHTFGAEFMLNTIKATHLVEREGNQTIRTPNGRIAPG